MSKLCVNKVCEDKVCVSKLCVEGGGGRRRRKEAAGYRTKNKNPTQRCGEKPTDSPKDPAFARASPSWTVNVMQMGPMLSIYPEPKVKHAC